jgi:hypothetical protein
VKPEEDVGRCINTYPFQTGKISCKMAAEVVFSLLKIYFLPPYPI